MIRRLLLAAGLFLPALASVAQVNEQDGDSIVPPGAAKYETGLYYRITSLSYTTLEVAGFMTGQERESVVVPETILDSISNRTYTITSVADSAFMGKTILKDVTLPNSVTRIRKDAFRGCSLTKAVVPGSVYHVEAGAYADNPLQEVYIYSPGVEGAPEFDHSVELLDDAFGETNGHMTDVYITYPNPPIIYDGDTPFPQEVARHMSATLHLADGADEDAYRTAYGWSDFFTPEPTAIELPGADDTAGVPPRYYTLQGVEVDAARLTPGLYIVRTDTKAVKTLLR